MDLENKYKKIEKTFLLYADTLTVNKVNPETDKEEFAIIPKEMLGESCQLPLVRKSILAKLLAAEKCLKRKNADLQIVVVEGYRSLEGQEVRFKEIYDRTAPLMIGKSEIEIFEECHKQIAVPAVAGHPTGAAVDVLIFDSRKQEMLDFGTGYCDWNAGKKLYYASPEVSKEAQRNRKLLRKIMKKQGFVQYMAEWWHFSYGDREYAVIRKKDEVLYGQKKI